MIVVVWEGVFGMATTQPFTASNSLINYTIAFANNFQAYRLGSFSARNAGNYYIELCAGAEVTCSSHWL